jgi:hypothetical protein
VNKVEIVTRHEFDAHCKGGDDDGMVICQDGVVETSSAWHLLKALHSLFVHAPVVLFVRNGDSDNNQSVRVDGWIIYPTQPRHDSL